uniref:Uncharacterized protein n=1 Tax=Siphoviridae sp. ctZd434 TaxID=2825559 RepID=A0A8S5UHJ0_9CAUD|nr:MAG TPA: hypothetical protein [Siphoviridae sp. ctZd434]
MASCSISLTRQVYTGYLRSSYDSFKMFVTLCINL